MLLSFQNAGQTSTAPTAPCDASVPANPSAIPTTGTAYAQPRGWGQPAKKVTQAGDVQPFLVEEIMHRLWWWSVDRLDGSVNPSRKHGAQQQPPQFLHRAV